MVLSMVDHRSKGGINLILRSGKSHVKSILQGQEDGSIRWGNYLKLDREKF